MDVNILRRVPSLIEQGLRKVGTRMSRWTKPISHPLLRDSIGDLMGSKQQLMMANLLLRQQLLVLNRSVKRPLYWLPLVSGIKITADDAGSQHRTARFLRTTRSSS